MVANHFFSGLTNGCDDSKILAAVATRGMQIKVFFHCKYAEFRKCLVQTTGNILVKNMVHCMWYTLPEIKMPENQNKT